MSKNKDFEKTEISKLKQTIRSLKGSLNSRDRKIEQLLSEIKTLKRAFDESVTYIDERLSDIPVEEIIKYFNRKRRGILKDFSNLESSSEDPEKWRCFSCKEGFIKLIIINRRDGKYYIRMCDKCSNRTKLKKYKDGVEGLLKSSESSKGSKRDKKI